MASPSSSVPDHLKRDPPSQPPPAAASHLMPPSAPYEPLHLESQPVVGYPPAIGYPHSYHGPPRQPSADPTRRFAFSGFARGVLAALVVFVALLCTINIIFNVMMRPKLPVFSVASLSVSNFNTSGSVLMASWETSVAVDNPNGKLKVRFDDIWCSVYYMEPSDSLAWTTGKPLVVGTNGWDVMDFSMASAGEEGQPERTVVEDIRQKRHSGTVSFALNLETRSTFRYGSWWTRHIRLSVSCVDLAVSFVGNEPGGVLDGDKPRGCRIL